MAAQPSYPTLETLRKLEACLCDEVRRHVPRRPRSDETQTASSFLDTSALGSSASRRRFVLWWPRLRRLVLVGGPLKLFIFIPTAALCSPSPTAPIQLALAPPSPPPPLNHNFPE